MSSKKQVLDFDRMEWIVRWISKILAGINREKNTTIQNSREMLFSFLLFPSFHF